jgi:hypothetical protein
MCHPKDKLSNQYPTAEHSGMEKPNHIEKRKSQLRKHTTEESSSFFNTVRATYEIKEIGCLELNRVFGLFGQGGVVFGIPNWVCKNERIL